MGDSFASAAETVKENGVDVATIRQVLADVSPSANDAKSDFQGKGVGVEGVDS